MNDTIFALATGPGRSAVAVIRLSGPKAGEALQALAGRLPSPRKASLRRLRASGGELLDQAIALWMPGPTSFTGEDCAELHLHGGAAVIAAVAEALSAAGLRPAEPGEFTRRAFERGRLDLSEAEAVADLVEAETSAQRAQALSQLEGGLSRRYAEWRETLLDALALLEVAVDFPDEEIPVEAAQSAQPLLSKVAQEMAAAALDTRGEKIREGYSVVLIGAPNVGKSSLLNVLAGRDLAIVTPIAGTTRDIVGTSLNIGGQLVHVSDTAGLRSGGDVIEAEGVRRARALADEADLRIGVVDQSRATTLNEATNVLKAGDVLALNKSDLLSTLPAVIVPQGVTQVSTMATPGGVEALRAVLIDKVGRNDAVGDFPAVTQARHRHLLQEAHDHLERALTDAAPRPELGAEGVRLAIRSLERVTGRTNPEAVLDRVFGRFCIGK